MNILVTGAAGYLGSILVPALLKQRHKVIAVDNFMYGQTSLMDCCFDRNLDIHRHDVRDNRFMAPLVKKVDAIIPLACIVGAPACDQKPNESQSINLESVLMLSESASKAQQIIVPITNSGYGVGQEGIYCTEETPMKPISLYGKLKVELENRLLEKGNAVSLRLATVFGTSPRMRMDLLVNDFVYRAVTDQFIVLFEAHFKRNYIHIRDVAKAFLHSLTQYNSMKGQAFNVGLSTANLSKMELCEAIKKQIPEFTIVESEIGKDPDKRNYIVSNEKIEKTGYHPDVMLHEGIADLIKGYEIVRRNAHSNL